MSYCKLGGRVGGWVGGWVAYQCWAGVQAIRRETSSPPKSFFLTVPSSHQVISMHFVYPRVGGWVGGWVDREERGGSNEVL